MGRIEVPDTGVDSAVGCTEWVRERPGRSLPSLCSSGRRQHTSAMNHRVCLHLHNSTNHSALCNMDESGIPATSYFSHESSRLSASSLRLHCQPTIQCCTTRLEYGVQLNSVRVYCDYFKHESAKKYLRKFQRSFPGESVPSR
jgi:hypothetical protein